MNYDLMFKLFGKVGSLGLHTVRVGLAGLPYPSWLQFVKLSWRT